MNKKPTLSISLLSCGNEPHIEDCLKGIAALREWMKVEIVVVDTSPEKSEDVRRVIKKYADKIVDFDWCDDFSAARNVGLQKCRGEWFMFVDDDEVLQNADSIANFFGSGDYRKYNTASIIIRNLGDEKGTKHFDQWAPRLYRKPKNAHFEGLVHEHFVPADYPLKALDAVVRHYGYVFETKKDLLDHIARNSRLLEKEIEEQPNEITARIHYLQEHVRKQDFIAQKRIALDCLARLEGMGGRQNSIYRGLCQGLIMRADRVEGRSGEALERFRSLMPAEDYLPVARAYFFKEAAKACETMRESIFPFMME